MVQTNEDGRAKFAFLIHPRTNVRADLAMAVHPLCRYIPLPERAIEWLIQFFPPIASGKISVGEIHCGYIIFVPFSARLMLTKPRVEVVRKIITAVQKAKDKGCSIVGLGALTAPTTGGGLSLIKPADEIGIGITNGNALTAGATIVAIDRCLQAFPYNQEHVKIAVVGATGSVGSGVATILAERGYKLMLVGRPSPNSDSYQDNVKLMNLYKCLSKINPRITVSVNVNDLVDQDIVIVTTSSNQALIKRRHLKRGAVVYDDTQPRNTDFNLRKEKDILVIDGGWLMAPELDISVNIDLPPEHAYACLVESFLLADSRRLSHYCIGSANVSQIHEMLELFEKSDFQLARFRSFGSYIPESRWKHIKMLVSENANSH